MATKITKVGDTYVYEFTNDTTTKETPDVSPEEEVMIDVVDGEATEEEVELRVREALEQRPAPRVTPRDRTEDEEDAQQG